MQHRYHNNTEREEKMIILLKNTKQGASLKNKNKGYTHTYMKCDTKY